MFRGLNEQMRQDVYNTMMYVGTSLQDSEASITDAHKLHAENREIIFRCVLRNPPGFLAILENGLGVLSTNTLLLASDSQG